MGAKARIWVQRIALAIASLAGVALVVLSPLPWWARAALIAAGCAIGIDRAIRHVPAFDPSFRVRWRLPRGPRGSRTCAVTFDDGPSPATSTVLDILAAENVRATFFVVGGNLARYPQVVRRARMEGHSIGIHGMNHATLMRAARDEVRRQVRGTLEALREAGVEPAKLYRTPHGIKSRAVFSVAAEEGMTLWAWSRGVWDTDLPAPQVLVRRATRLAGDRMVLLLHDGHDDEAEPEVGPMLAALPSILRELKRRGFTFVTLDQTA